MFVGQDVEVPLHLLRYVCLFCGKHGLSLMKECFESGTPESLPFPIAHAFITIVSNVSPLTPNTLNAGCHFKSHGLGELFLAMTNI